MLFNKKPQHEAFNFRYFFLLIFFFVFLCNSLSISSFWLNVCVSCCEKKIPFLVAHFKCSSNCISQYKYSLWPLFFRPFQPIKRRGRFKLPKRKKEKKLERGMTKSITCPRKERKQKQIKSTKTLAYLNDVEYQKITVKISISWKCQRPNRECLQKITKGPIGNVSKKKTKGPIGIFFCKSLYFSISNLIEIKEKFYFRFFL